MATLPAVAVSLKYSPGRALRLLHEGFQMQPLELIAIPTLVPQPVTASGPDDIGPALDQIPHVRLHQDAFAVVYAGFEGIQLRQFHRRHALPDAADDLVSAGRRQAGENLTLELPRLKTVEPPFDRRADPSDDGFPNAVE